MAEVRLRRSREHKVVGGVIGGFAEYFDRDPGLLRLLYVLISIVSAAFPGIFVYLILWALIPQTEASRAVESRTASDPIAVP
ncbi:MAG: PspC domain-containing protein [Thermoanaerobaculia bacterium]|jgi:phage shock protein PspC (stress-responsive transcriptional regulator)|nr:PspC domain-containing protein [Thermoanaerobaculia bacterium]